MDVIVLAGGRGRRMGGRDKALLRVGGRRLIDHLLSGLGEIGGVNRVVVVSSRITTADVGVPVVKEDRPFSGPVPAILAGLGALRHQPAAATAVLAVDAPLSPSLLPDLHRALLGGRADAAVIRSGDGRVQPLCAVWTTRSLWCCITAMGDTDNQSVMTLIKAAGRVVELAGTGAERDYDTVGDLALFPEDGTP
ncbi:molybdenum cofactor guanylyltransferase [Corynebacterium pacaense]|uniref:molybdenum cofactor guanylyltransferase n=1 Tax=Corynebacterium pacaense TaxID=1816684 RepID=UPI0009BA59AF|nr:NTP transferase domain-containing protein [Corynebacterium pacaense]